MSLKIGAKTRRISSRHLAEATVCLANADGGLVIIGVHDRNVGRAAFERCRFGTVRPDWVRARIAQLTKPPVKCHVERAGDAIPNLPCVESEDVIIIQVFKRSSPTAHATNDGISYVRVDKECTQYRIGDEDFTKSPPDHLDEQELDWASVDEAVRHREARSTEGKAPGHQSRDYLLEAGLVRMSDRLGSKGEAQYFLSVAGLLLFGKEKSIAAEFPAAQTNGSRRRPGQQINH